MSNISTVSENLSLHQQADHKNQTDKLHAGTNITTSMQNAPRNMQLQQIVLAVKNEELYRVQVDLDASRARYFSLYNHAPVGYCTVSEKGLILEANLTTTTLLGVTHNVLIQRPITHFILIEDQDIYFHHHQQLFKTGTPQTCELRIQKNGEPPCWVQLAASIAHDADGIPVCQVAISDIAERKRAEAALHKAHAELEQRVIVRTKELQDTNEQLRAEISERQRAEKEKGKLEVQNRQLQKSESLGRMAGAIAHHFNNQLAAVMMNLNLAMDTLPRNSDAGENLAEALQAAQQAAEVSSLMLTYLGQTNCQCEPLDLAHTSRQSLSLLRAVMPQNVILETDLPISGPTVTANTNQFHQVLTNLVANAWEASGDAQSTIRLSVKTVSKAEIPTMHRFPIDWSPETPAYACLEIADEGCGIASSDIEKLCDPFFSTKFIGRGMGLAVVLGIVRTYKGLVTVESQPGRGSTFRVFLPVTAAVAPQKSVPAAPASNVTRTDTILVVEDVQSVRHAFAKALQQLGFSVLVAGDGVEAVEIFRQHQLEIRCVLCDLTMPRMNGWETLKSLRKLEPDIPVILSSGYNEAQAMTGQHSELPQAFLGKPCTLEELKDAVARVMGK